MRLIGVDLHMSCDQRWTV